MIEVYIFIAVVFVAGYILGGTMEARRTRRMISEMADDYERLGAKVDAWKQEHGIK